MGLAFHLASMRLTKTPRFMFLCCLLSKPQDNDTSIQFDEAALVAAHWWAAPTYDKKQANMATSHVSH
eukprot:4366157-Pyramimonas_sp.AAC.1